MSYLLKILTAHYMYYELGPFVTTSNGWFGAWGGLLATVKWSIGLKNLSFYSDGDESQPSGMRQLYILAICSVILLFASIPPLTQGWEHKGGAGLAIAGSTITCIACAYLISMYSDVPRNMMKVTVVMLFVLWTVVACVCTFRGPFLFTSKLYRYASKYMPECVPVSCAASPQPNTVLSHFPAMVDNGFFAAWIGCLSAFNLLLTEMKDASPEHS